MTVGPWRPISIQHYDTRISEIRIQSNVADDKSVKVDVAFNVSAPGPKKASVHLKSLDGQPIAGHHDVSCDGSGNTSFDLTTGSVDLWYPIGYGKQPLYLVEIQITDTVRHPPT